MDLAQVKSFAAVVRHRSFSQAAKDVRLTQPGVSRQVQNLENELGVPLLARRRGGIELTAEGERFRIYAEHALEEHAQLIRDLHSQEKELCGHLRIVASTTPGEFLVPWIAAAFTALHPKVHPKVSIVDSEQVLVALRERRYDVGFVATRPSGTDLVFHPVAEDEVVLAVPADHPFATRAEVSLEELEGQPFLEREPGSGTLLTFRAALAERGVEAPAYRPVMVLSSTQAVVSGVQSGHGLGLISSLVMRFRPPERVATVRLADLQLQRRVYLVTVKGLPSGRPAGAFAAWVGEVAGSATAD